MNLALALTTWTACLSLPFDRLTETEEPTEPSEDAPSPVDPMPERLLQIALDGESKELLASAFGAYDFTVPPPEEGLVVALSADENDPLFALELGFDDALRVGEAWEASASLSNEAMGIRLLMTDSDGRPRRLDDDDRRACIGSMMPSGPVEDLSAPAGERVRFIPYTVDVRCTDVPSDFLDTPPIEEDIVATIAIEFEPVVTLVGNP
ncbi:MAG: hypothetical protein AAGA48_21920 [Myxococcota bacterium]